jgi:hypothetical protein
VAIPESGGRINQKARTQRAIFEACVELIRQRRSVTMPEVAKAAMVSEATAYRYALAPFVDVLDEDDPELLAQLRLDLAVVVSAEALFCLTDLCGLSTEDAMDSAEQTARTLTAAAFRQVSWRS